MHFSDVPDPTLYAIPFFIGSLLLEAWILKRRPESRMGYERWDTAASLLMGIVSINTVTLLHVAIFALSTWLYEFRWFELRSQIALWVMAMVAWDFAYYFHHRIEHEVRLFWASHVNHHSSRHYNYSTALRQPWTPFIGLVLYPPLSLLGIPPWMILMCEGFNLIYQFWVHTETIPKLWAPLEFVFNTASHHRVHHGSNARYLDKNYGGILIIWDRLFGTFCEENEPVVYGLTKNIDSFNPLVIAFHEYLAIARDLRTVRSVKELVRCLFGRPGAFP